MCLKPSHAAFAVRSGCEAAETRPESVMLTFWRYWAGCVMLYGSRGLRPRAKFTRPAVPLTTPPRRCIPTSSATPHGTPVAATPTSSNRAPSTRRYAHSRAPSPLAIANRASADSSEKA